MQAVQPFIQTLLLQAMALYIHGPLHCKDLLGRIPNPHSCHALAVPQHAPGPRSDARSQCIPPGGEHAQNSSTTPRHRTGRRTPSTTRTPTIRPPGGIPRAHAAHTHTAQLDTQPPTLEAVQHPQPYMISPQTARKPTRLSSRTGFFFCVMEPDTARRKRLGRTTQPNRRPCYPLHPYSAGEIIHRAVRERTTTSTTAAPRPRSDRPRRWASKARHTARHFFASKAQTRHFPGILNPL